ncbi:MAG: hypothetical protein Tsb0013_13040 [Phycisphaerales bacterium]
MHPCFGAIGAVVPRGTGFAFVLCVPPSGWEKAPAGDGLKAAPHRSIWRWCPPPAPARVLSFTAPCRSGDRAPPLAVGLFLFPSGGAGVGGAAQGHLRRPRCVWARGGGCIPPGTSLHSLPLPAFIH